LLFAFFHAAMLLILRYAFICAFCHSLLPRLRCCCHDAAMLYALPCCFHAMMPSFFAIVFSDVSPSPVLRYAARLILLLFFATFSPCQSDFFITAACRHTMLR